jgi:hypothetical protein
LQKLVCGEDRYAYLSESQPPGWVVRWRYDQPQNIGGRFSPPLKGTYFRTEAAIQHFASVRKVVQPIDPITGEVSQVKFPQDSEENTLKY